MKSHLLVYVMYDLHEQLHSLHFAFGVENNTIHCIVPYLLRLMKATNVTHPYL